MLSLLIQRLICPFAAVTLCVDANTAPVLQTGEPDLSKGMERAYAHVAKIIRPCWSQAPRCLYLIQQCRLCEDRSLIQLLPYLQYLE